MRSSKQPVKSQRSVQPMTGTVRVSRGLAAAAVASGSLLVAPSVLASPELAAQYDGRSVGMAGTGISFLHNGASVFYNPAGLDGVEQFAVTGVASPFLPKATVPMEGPDDSTASSSQLVPLFLIGGAYRATDRLVLGLAAFPAMGFGSKFDNIQALGGQGMEFQTALIEVSPAASFRIAEGLAVGASYRFTYATQKMGVVIPMPDPTTGAPTPTRMENSLTGTDFAGFGLGVSYAPTPDLNLAASYRSRVTSELSGTTTLAGQSFETTSEAATPHRLQLEASHQFLQDRLLLALSAKYLMYKSSNDKVDTTMQTPGGPQTSTVELNWQNVPGFALGGEYLATERVPVRLGYSLSKSATPEENAGPFSPGPGWTHSVHGGGGYRFEAFDVDLGGEYVFARSEAEPTAGLPGAYDFDALVVSLSATYHH
jgi:long-chain fatty acid transport protein